MNRPTKLLSLVTPEKLRHIVTSLGWKQVSSLHNDKVLQYLSPDGRNIATILNDHSFSDYNEVTYRSIKEIALNMKEDVEHFLNRFLFPAYDVLKWRVGTNESGYGTVSFESMEKSISSIKNILATTCLNIESTESYHNKLFTKSVNEKLSKYSFGQTEIGGYILNILCPLGGTSLSFLELNEEELPFYRRVNIKLMESISYIQTNLEEGNFTLIDEKMDEGFVNVNFLEKLSDLYEDFSDSPMSLSVDWSKEIPIQKDFGEIKINSSLAEPLNQLVERHLPQKEIETSVDYIGKLCEFSGDLEINTRSDLWINAVVLVDEEKRLNVKFKIPQDKQDEAICAFKESKYVRIKGTIEKATSKTQTLQNVTFDIIH